MVVKISGEENYSISIEKGIYFKKPRYRVNIHDDREGSKDAVYLSESGLLEFKKRIDEVITSKQNDFNEDW